MYATMAIRGLTEVRAQSVLLEPTKTHWVRLPVSAVLMCFIILSGLGFKNKTVCVYLDS